MGFKFEQLKVWQKAVDLSADVHTLTRGFPKEELHILTSQIMRASDSISLNIAEGSTGQTNGELKQFLGYALRSAIEVVACLHLAKKRHLLGEREFTKLYENTEEVVRMLQGFRKTL